MDSKFQKRNCKIGAPYLVIDQTETKSINNGNNAEIYSYRERGLSRSRNHTLEHAKGEICLLSDDDLEYKKNIESAILEAFDNNPDADIITFQIETPEGEPFNNYSEKQLIHNKRSIMRAASVEIAFKRSSIEEAGLKFDENFGLGAKFPTGEENIFLSDALDKGLNVLYIPEPIVIHPAESSGQDYNDPGLVQAKGAMFERIFGWQGYGVSFLFAFKKYKESKYSLFGFYSLMLEGAKNYRRKKGL